MATTTPTYGLSKPAVNSPQDEDLWGTELNSNMDTLDTVLAAKLSSAAPVWTGAGSGGSLSLSSTLGVTGVATLSAGIAGTTTNNSAATGIVGELISSTVTSGAATALVTNTAKTITSISLTAGDWDITGSACFSGATNTNLNNSIGSISTVTNATNLTPGNFSEDALGGTAFDSTNPKAHGIGPVQASLTATTTYYLVSQAGFTVSTCSGYGIIRARRMR